MGLGADADAVSDSGTEQNAISLYYVPVPLIYWRELTIKFASSIILIKTLDVINIRYSIVNVLLCFTDTSYKPKKTFVEGE